MQTTDTQRRLLRLAGALLAAGFAIFAVVTAALHPSHDENDHPVIFAKYAASDEWVAVHLVQFAGVLIALGGFITLHRVLVHRGHDGTLARLALGTTIATAAAWAVLQAVDGTALKQAVDAWAGATGAERSARFADAETVRWTEWGLQSYFRLLMGTTLVLFGTAAIRGRVIARWAGWAGIVAGTAYATIGVAVGHSGLDKPGGPAVQLLILTFVAGVVLAGRRRPAAVPRLAHRAA